MTTTAPDQLPIDGESDVQHGRPEADAPAPASVANPRRTTWTGFAKNAADRLPSA